MLAEPVAVGVAATCASAVGGHPADTLDKIASTPTLLLQLPPATGLFIGHRQQCPPQSECNLLECPWGDQCLHCGVTTNAPVLLDIVALMMITNIFTRQYGGNKRCHNYKGFCQQDTVELPCNGLPSRRSTSLALLARHRIPYSTGSTSS